MGRGSTGILIRKVVECLTEGPRTIAEIAEATGLDRTAIGKYVNLLKDSKLLFEEQIGSSKKFTITPTYRTDTYFGLPLEKVSEQQISSVYHLINKYWAEKTEKRLSSTYAQKIAFKVIKTCNELKIPSGWYMYGGMSVAPYDGSVHYPYYSLPQKVDLCVKEVVKEVVPFDHAWQVKNWQYTDAPELYKVKEGILKILYGPKINEEPKNSLHIIIKLVRKLLSLTPKVDRKNYVDILDAYQDLLLDMYNKLDDKRLIEHKQECIELFEAIWRYIALFNFKNDLLKFYNKEILDMHFLLDIQQQEAETIELGTQLQSLIPETDIAKKRMYDALNRMKSVDPKQLEKQNNELETLQKEKRLEEYNKGLLNKFGF